MTLLLKSRVGGWVNRIPNSGQGDHVPVEKALFDCPQLGARRQTVT